MVLILSRMCSLLFSPLSWFKKKEINPPIIKLGEFTDNRDGQIYRTITINNLTWLGDNLRYRDVPHYSVNNDNANNASNGLLYTHEYAVKACPPGWRLPTDEELAYLTQIARDKNDFCLRNRSWVKSNKNNSFELLPTGFRWNLGFFTNFGAVANIWSGNYDVGNNALSLYVDSDCAMLVSNNRENGFSVRCVRANIDDNDKNCDKM